MHSFDSRPFDASLPQEDRELLAETAELASVSDQLERWLERTPFIDMGDYSFRDEYRRTVQNILDDAGHDIWAVNVDEEYHEEDSSGGGRHGTGRDAPVLPRQTPRVLDTEPASIAHRAAGETA